MDKKEKDYILLSLKNLWYSSSPKYRKELLQFIEVIDKIEKNN